MDTAVPVVEVRRRHQAPGAPRLAALDRHRLMLHLSPATRTSCVTTGYRAVRTRGDIDIVAAHAVDGFEACAGYSSLEVLVAPGLLQRAADEFGLPPARARLSTACLLRDERLQGLLMALEADLRAGSPGAELFRDSVGASLAAALLLPGRPSAQDCTPAHAMQRVVDYIEAHLDQALTLERLAAVAGVGPSSLQRAFKRWQGLAVHQYVVQRRVARARALIAEGQAPLAQVALMAGFAHQSHMARWLRRLD